MLRPSIPVIDATYPLAATLNALRHLEEKHARGKIVISVVAEGGSSEQSCVNSLQDDSPHDRVIASINDYWRDASSLPMGKSTTLRRAISGRLRLSRMAFRDPGIYHTVRSVSREGLTYLGAGALLDLHEGVANVEAQALDGILVEAGSALGGSAIVMAKSKTESRPLFLYDVFGMIPPPSTRDQRDAHKRYDEIVSGDASGIRDGTYYGYEENLIVQVADSFHKFDLPPEENQIELVQGLYEDTLIIDQPVALAHIDCDWYDSVMTCLERIVPWLVPGGLLIIDDYEEWSGCKQAVDDFFASRRNDFTFKMRTRLHITRNPRS